jgi:Fe-S-cluster-containing hydrogenase component 2
MICEFACSAAKEGRFDLDLARIRVLRATPTRLDVVACYACASRPCIKECPRGALSVGEDTETITLDKARCAGCGWCLEACPFGAIALDGSTKTVIMCDLCQGQEQPQCIRSCPHQALSLHVSVAAPGH